VNVGPINELTDVINKIIIYSYQNQITYYKSQSIRFDHTGSSSVQKDKTK